MFLMGFFRAINAENGEANKVKNRLTGEWGSVPDTARHYKVISLKLTNCISYSWYM